MNQEHEASAAEQVIQWLVEATSRVGRDYFQLPIDGSPDRVFREGVYCYELYHQLRVLMPDEFPYSLGGEVDKSAHPLMRANRVRDTIPDLLIHRPGYMRGNLVIIEVKPSGTRINDVKKDLAKTSNYIKTARYVRGAMLLYGPDESRADEVTRDPGIAAEFCDRISLLWHQSVGERARRIKWAA